MASASTSLRTTHRNNFNTNASAKNNTYIKGKRENRDKSNDKHKDMAS